MMKRLAENQELRVRLALNRNGVPFDVAFALSYPEAFAWFVIHGEEVGGVKFDWKNMRWPDPPKGSR